MTNAVRTQVLSLLRSSNDFVSGQEISNRLGITRAAIWKHIDALRNSGYEIESVTNRGYRLVSSPDVLCAEDILSRVEAPITVLETVDSTNTYLKQAAAAGAPAGTCVLAEQQTMGRGRMGRSFSSPAGCGIYLSYLLHPELPPHKLLHLTAMAAVAAVRAVSRVSGITPQIKWTNDLVVGDKKLAGILTELTLEAESGLVQYGVIGIGINVNQASFDPAIADMATSLSLITGKITDRNQLAAALIRELQRLEQELISGKKEWLAEYRSNCLTLGKPVKVVQGDTVRFGTALDLDEDGGLLVQFGDTVETVNAGEVSVRGLYGYTK